MMKGLLLMPATLLAAFPTITQAATPEENLDCAVWTSFRMDATTEAEIFNGLGFTLSWFIGLYEGATGTSIDDAMVARSATITDAELRSLDQRCLSLMQGYGNRLSKLGDRLVAQGN